MVGAPERRVEQGFFGLLKDKEPAREDHFEGAARWPQRHGRSHVGRRRARAHAGSALLAQIADKSGLTQALSVRLAELKQRRSGHDPGRVVRVLAVMLADGGDCLADLGAVRDQDALFGAVASDSTAFRVIDRIASTPGLRDVLADAHAVARERVWALTGPPDRVTIDVDATLRAIPRSCGWA
jgi:hypothetical protein